jgi:hypothetical protein
MITAVFPRWKHCRFVELKVQLCAADFVVDRADLNFVTLRDDHLGYDAANQHDRKEQREAAPASFDGL